METNFNFNSQVCTDKNQSERLLALGLKKETADMHWYKPAECELDYWYVGVGESWATTDIPAWSLHRLIEMCDVYIKIYRLRVVLSNYEVFNEKETTYDNLIDYIEWLIKEGYFNKEYLEE